MFKQVRKHTSRIGLHKVKILITIKLKELILPKESIDDISNSKLFISFEKDGKQSISEDIILQLDDKQENYNYNTIPLNNNIELALTLYKNPTTNEFQYKQAKVILKRAIKHNVFVSPLAKEKIFGIYNLNLHEFATMMGYEKSLNKEIMMNLDPYTPASKGMAISSEICLKLIHSHLIDDDNMSTNSFISDSSYASTNTTNSRTGISHIKSFHINDPFDLSTHQQQHIIHINETEKHEEDDKDDFNTNNDNNNTNNSESEYDPTADIEENITSFHHNSSSIITSQTLTSTQQMINSNNSISNKIQNKTRIKNTWKNNFLFRRNPRTLSLHTISAKTNLEMDHMNKEYKECSSITNQNNKDDESSSNSDRARKNKEAFELYHKELRSRAKRITHLEQQNSLTIKKYQTQITELRSELNQKDTALKKERIARSTIAKVTDKGDQVLASVLAEAREQVQMISIQLDNTKAELSSSLDEINHYKNMISELFREKDEQLHNSEEVASIVANTNLKIMEMEEENDDLVKALIDVKIDNANIHMELDQEKRINYSLKKTIKEYNDKIRYLESVREGNNNSSQEEKRSIKEYRSKGAIPYGTGLGI